MVKAESPTPQARLIQLDFLRGIAILLVIGYHGVINPNTSGHLKPIPIIWHHIGWIGVDLFFVLSGFLVGGLLFQEYKRRDKLDIKRFIIRRSFKIFPSYVVYLIAVALYLVLVSHMGMPEILRTLALNLVSLQNYTHASTLPSVLPHTWSLAVEEHFYLFLPFLLLWMTTRSPRTLHQWFPITALTIMLVCLVVRIYTAHDSTTYGTLAWSEKHQWPTHLRADSLFFGVLLAYYYHLRPEKLKWWLSHPGSAAIIGLVLVAIPMAMPAESTFIWTFGYSLLALGFGSVLLACLSAPSLSQKAKRFFDSFAVRFIASVGTFSYSIYLWHIMLGQPLPKAFARQPWLIHTPELRWTVVTLIYLFAAIVVGIVFGKLIEYPALALRDRLFPSSTRAVATNQSSSFLAKSESASVGMNASPETVTADRVK